MITAGAASRSCRGSRRSDRPPGRQGDDLVLKDCSVSDIIGSPVVLDAVLRGNRIEPVGECLLA